MDKANVILLEVQPRDPVTGARVTLRLAGGGADYPYRYAGQNWEAGLAVIPSVGAMLDYQGTDLGVGAIPQALQLEWNTAVEAKLNAKAALHWAGAPFTLWLFPENATGTLPGAPLQVGKVMAHRVTDSVLQLAMADPATDLQRPLAPDTFAGTGGLEGPAEWEGRRKRRVWGQAFNIEGEPIDPPNNVYCFGDPARPWQSFDQVRDKGAAAAALTILGWQGSVAATFAALQAAAAPSGGGVAAPSIAMVKWWTRPAGILAADVKGENTGAYLETAADIAQAMVQSRGGPAFLAGTVAAANALRSRPCGYVADDSQTTISAALDWLLGGVSLLWVLEAATGQIRIAPWAFTASVGTFRSDHVDRVEAYAPLQSRKIGYRRNHRVHSAGDLAGIVTYGDGTPIDDYRPGEPGSTNGATIGVNVRLVSSAVPTQGQLVTAEGTAAAIAGQGALATANQAAYGSQISGLPGAIQPGNILSGGYLNAGQVQYGPGGPLVVTLQPAQAGADVTGTNIAAAITGQAPAATDPTVQAGATNDTGADTRSTDYAPQHYRDNWVRRLRTEFKFVATVGSPAGATGTYGSLETYSAWQHHSGGPVWQRFTDSAGARFIRYSLGLTPDETWGAWQPEYSGNRRPYFGADLLEQGGGAVATLANFKTPLGTAAAIAGQAATATNSDFAVVTGATKPQSNATNDRYVDRRNTNELPSFYRTNYPFHEAREFKDASMIGIAGTAAGTFGGLITKVDYNHISGGQVKQEFQFGFSNGGYVIGQKLLRSATSDTAWGSWERDYNAYSKPYFGTDLLEALGGAVATLGNFKTPLGTAAGIAGQGALATRGTVEDGYFSGAFANRVLPYAGDNNYLAAGRVAWSAGATVESLKPGEVGANVTEARTAAAIAGQGSLATRSNIIDGFLSGSLATRLAPHPLNGNFLGAATIAYTDGQHVQNLRPGEANANVTETRVAAAIAGQASAATDTTIQAGATNDRILDTRAANQTPGWYRTNYAYRERVEFKDGYYLGIPGIPAAGYYGALTTTTDYIDGSGGQVKQRYVAGAPYAPANIQPGTAFERVSTSDTVWSAWYKSFSGVQRPIYADSDLLESAGTVATLANFKTGLGTAGAIAGQGAFATQSSAAWTTQITGRPTELTDGRVSAGLDSVGSVKRALPASIGSAQSSTVTRPLPRGAKIVTLRDGEAYSFQTAWGSGQVPSVQAYNNGYIDSSNYLDCKALGLTASGFTADCKKVGPGTLTARSETTAGTATAPRQREIVKGLSDEAHDDSYNYTFTVVITNTPSGEPGIYNGGEATIGLWTYDGATWQLNNTVQLYGEGGSASTTTRTGVTGTCGRDGMGTNDRFGVSVESSTAGANITAFTSVTYNTTTGNTVSSATPTNFPGIPFLILGGTE